VDPEEKNSSIVKDRVYQLPMVRPTTWKGRLRFSSKQEDESDELVNHLFGLSSDLEDNQEGRLHFFPTFFTPTMDGSETINPHSRSTRRGRLLGPVEIKCVDAETEGTFCLLYLGPALPGTSQDSIIASVLSSVRKMIEFHGIGGKTLKGFGLGVISETWLSTDRGRSKIEPDAEGGPN
jgi:CRISPR-associated protein Cmr2